MADVTPGEAFDSLDDEVKRLLGRVDILLASTKAEIAALTRKSHELIRLRSALASYLAGFEGDVFDATHYQRICDFLASKPDGCTLEEIEGGTGIRQSSVSAVVYRTHPGKFVKGKRGRRNTWRLNSACL